MSKMKWDETGEKLFEAGIKEVMLYTWEEVTSGSTVEKRYSQGVGWNGVSACNESPSGGDETAIYANDTKYLSLRAKEDFGGTIEAYMYPDEWEECDGSKIVSVTNGAMRVGQQARKLFGLTYVTTIGNDTESYDFGEKLHFVYGATASPSGKDHATINESPDVSPFSWEFTTIPLSDPAHLTFGTAKAIKPIAHFSISSTDFTGGVTDPRFQLIKAMIQGRDAVASETAPITELIPFLPYPNEVYAVLSAISDSDAEAAIPARFKPATESESPESPEVQG